MKTVTTVLGILFLAPMMIACGNRGDAANEATHDQALTNYAGGPLSDYYDDEHVPAECTYLDLNYGWEDDNGYTDCIKPQAVVAVPTPRTPDLRSSNVLDFNDPFTRAKVPGDQKQPIVLETSLSQLRLHNGTWERTCANLAKAMMTAPDSPHRVFASHRTPFTVVPMGGAHNKYSTRDLTVCQYLSSSYREPAYFAESRTLSSKAVTLRLTSVLLFSIEKINSRVVIVDQPQGLGTQRRIFLAAKNGELNSRLKDCLNAVDALVAGTHKANGVEIKIDLKGADLARDASGSYQISESAVDHMTCSNY